MSLLEHARGSPHFIQLRNWERAIWKETVTKAHADAADEEERKETLKSITLNGGKLPRRKRGGTPPTTPPKPFIRNHSRNRLELTKPNERHWPGAFDAHTSACPGSGFLPKPNMFVPGVEPALGPVPKKLVKGEYPASYVFARGNECGTMSWPSSIDTDQVKERKAREKMSETAPGGFVKSGSTSGLRKTECQKCPECNRMTLSSSSPALGSTGGSSKFKSFGSNFGRNRPPSGIKAIKAQARMTMHVNANREDEAFGSTSDFLSTTNHHTNGWLSEFNAQNRADSGQVYYWGC